MQPLPIVSSYFVFLLRREPIYEEPSGAGEAGGTDQEPDPLHRVRDRSEKLEERGGQIASPGPFGGVNRDGRDRAGIYDGPT